MKPVGRGEAAGGVGRAAGGGVPVATGPEPSRRRGAAPTGPERVHRLRDVGGRGRIVVLVVAMALAAPFAASVARAVQHDWTPSNDEALIALRVHDVLAGEWPLVGQPSTAEQYADSDPPSHPGPLEFYLLAPFVVALGSDVGMLVGAAAITLGSVLIACWVAFRRAGPAVGLGAAVVLSGLAWAQGTAVLTDPISSNIGGIPLVALAALAWAVVDGDLRLLPLAAFLFAFVCQAHLAVVGVATGLAAWTSLGVVVAIIAWGSHRRGRAVGAVVDPRGWLGSRPDAPWPWIGGAAAVTVASWFPVLVDQVAGTGNLGRIVRFAGSSDRDTLGVAAGIRQALRALGAPPLILRTDLTGDDIHAGLSTVHLLGCLAVVAALVAVVVVDRRRARTRAALAATALVIALLGGVNGSNVPESVEAARLNFYRWAFVASALAWLAIGWAVVDRIGGRVRDKAGPRPRQASWAAGLAALVVVSALTVVASEPRARRDEELFGHERDLAAAMLDAVEGRERVMLIPSGRAAVYAIAPSLALQLVEAGHQLGVPANQEAGYGDHLVASGRFDAGLVLATGRGDVPDGPGRVIARIDLNEATVDVRAELAEQLRGRDLVVSDRADEVLDDLMGSAASDPATLFAMLMATLSDDPESALLHPLVPRALRAGYLTSPEVDPDLLDVLIANPPHLSWGDDVLELRLLSASQVSAFAAG